MYKIIVNRLETQVYNQQHTKSILAKERIVLTQKLNVVKNENQQMAREIQRNKMFNKKDQDRKAKKEQADKLAAIIKDLNKDIEEHDVKLDMEKRRLDDRSLLKKQMEVTMQLKQDFNKVNIDISIAESRIKDLEGLREMSLSQLKDIIAEKRAIEKDNEEIEVKIAGKGVSEQEQKAKQFDAEREQLKKISNSLKFQREVASDLMERLKEEETKAKDMLDEKIKQQQQLTQDNVDLSEAKLVAEKNKEDIIKMRIRLSQLISQEEKMKEELEKLKKENEFYVKRNAEFEQENAELQKEIALTIQKIDINSLLKEIDIEDMRLLAQSNKQMNQALHSLINKWETIQKAQ